MPGRVTAGALLLLLACASETGGDDVSLPDRILKGPPMDHSGLRAALERVGPDPLGLAELGAEDVWALVREFYVRRGDQPAWVDPWGRPSDQARDLVAALEAAGSEGLVPADHGSARVRALWREVDRADPSREAVHDLDVGLTQAFFSYGRALARGRVSPDQVGWELAPRDVSLRPLLESALDRGDVGPTLARLAPRNPQYDALRGALARYRAIERGGGWRPVPGEGALREGDAADPAVLTALEERLRIEGHLEAAQPAAGAAAAVYDERMARGVRRFQEAHGLAPDGVVGEGTRAALAIPVEERVRTLTLNLERWRWMPEDLGAPHVFVNLPAFRLQVRDGAGILADMPVVIGQEGWKTPVFSDEIERVVFHPYWGVPQSILRQDLLPRIRRDPGYLQRNGYEVRDSRGRTLSPDAVDWSRPGAVAVRQRPGAGNALGRVKFLFPNAHAVYLHDTPARHLFTRPARAFSHGCVRVGDPEELAEVLLRGTDGWDEGRVGQALASRRHQTVELSQPIPVHLAYFTAWVDDDGALRFLPDVYGHDGALARQLADGSVK